MSDSPAFPSIPLRPETQAAIRAEREKKLKMTSKEREQILNEERAREKSERIAGLVWTRLFGNRS